MKIDVESIEHLLSHFKSRHERTSKLSPTRSRSVERISASASDGISQDPAKMSPSGEGFLQDKTKVEHTHSQNNKCVLRDMQHSILEVTTLDDLELVFE